VPELSDLLSVPQVAERLGADVRLVRKMLDWKQLPHVQVGSRKMVPRVAVEQFVSDASAARVGASTALRLFGALVAAGWRPPEVGR
jgi:excisionase family DNA binding protein